MPCQDPIVSQITSLFNEFERNWRSLSMITIFLRFIFENKSLSSSVLADFELIQLFKTLDQIVTNIGDPMNIIVLNDPTPLIALQHVQKIHCVVVKANMTTMIPHIKKIGEYTETLVSLLRKLASLM